MTKTIYIVSKVEITPQNPLTQEWLSRFIKPLEARRMSVGLRRALTTALTALQEAGLERPDAIIGGTARGQVEDTETLLTALCTEGESTSMPTRFMQSTHNTVCSQIAIRTKCHGYNCTYAQGEQSLACALLDAMLQLRSGAAESVLVTLNDEGEDYTSEAMVLQTNPTSAPIGILEDVKIEHITGKGDEAQITIRKC